METEQSETEDPRVSSDSLFEEVLTEGTILPDSEILPISSENPELVKNRDQIDAPPIEKDGIILGVVHEKKHSVVFFTDVVAFTETEGLSADELDPSRATALGFNRLNQIEGNVVFDSIELTVEELVRLRLVHVKVDPTGTRVISDPFDASPNRSTQAVLTKRGATLSAVILEDDSFERIPGDLDPTEPDVFDKNSAD